MRPLTYLRTLPNTFSSPSYYQEVARAPLSFSLRFALLSLALLAIGRISFLWIHQLPHLEAQAAQAYQELYDNFPEKLRIDWTGDELKTNADQPVVVQYPSFWSREDLPKALAVIDDKSETLSQVEERAQTSSLIFLTHKILFLSQVGGGYSDLPFSEVGSLIPAMSFTKQILRDNQTSWLANINAQIRTGVGVFSLVYPLYLVLNFSVSILFCSLLGWYFVRSFGMKLRYAKVFQLGLHIGIVAQTAHLIGHLFWPNVGFPLFTLTFWSYFLVVMIALRRQRP